MDKSPSGGSCSLGIRLPIDGCGGFTMENDHLFLFFRIIDDPIGNKLYDVKYRLQAQLSRFPYPTVRKSASQRPRDPEAEGDAALRADALPPQADEDSRVHIRVTGT